MSEAISSECAYCQPDDFAWRTINSNELITSIVASPAFRELHCVVFPNRHAAPSNRLSFDEKVEIYRETGRLSVALGVDRGTCTLSNDSHNYQGLDHVRYHVYPRHPGYEMMPNPDGARHSPLFVPEVETVIALAKRLRPDRQS